MTESTYFEQRMSHWNSLAIRGSKLRWKIGSGLHRRVRRVYGHLVPVGMRVLELGCGKGDLLNALEPSTGVGIDISQEMIAQAQTNHPHLTFAEARADRFEIDGQFDFVILSGLVNDLWDVQSVLEHIRQNCHDRTRIILNSYSRLWELPLRLARALGLAKPNLRQNWLTVEDLEGLLQLSGYEVIRSWREVLMPVRIPGIDAIFNRFLARLWPFRYAGLCNFLLARPSGAELQKAPETVSVIIAARNEAGHIAELFERTPDMGAGTEIIFVEGNSTDETFEVIEREIAAHPAVNASLYKQPGKGKGDAVRLGFEKATGDILMILDADITVPPETLPRFYDAVHSGLAEFANGVRLVYPMADRAMRGANVVGNKFFSLAFTWLLGQPVKDTLCGTKVLRKADYQRIANNRAYFGDFDPFGDFDLLFGAAKQNLKIVDLPIRYGERRYGDTNISRWSHGFLLLRMVVFAATRIKFV